MTSSSRQLLLLKLAAPLLLTLGLGGTASASVSPIFQVTDWMFGSQFKTYSFQVASSGGYRASLTDYQFPYPFQSLGLAIAQGARLYGQTWAAPEAYLDFAADPGTYTALVYGDAADATSMYNGTLYFSLSPGAYGITVAALPAVPEADTWMMMLAGLGVLSIWLARRGRNRGGAIAA